MRAIVQRILIFTYILETCLGLRLWSDFVVALAWIDRRIQFDRVVPYVIFLVAASTVILVGI
ncbi:MAG: hypothetical protein LBI34_02215 [Puniceicoccales bacterium]|nr:hypothetical protein [Puniceicoccales bacterium]